MHTEMSRRMAKKPRSYSSTTSLREKKEAILALKLPPLPEGSMRRSFPGAAPVESIREGLKRESEEKIEKNQQQRRKKAGFAIGMRRAEGRVDHPVSCTKQSTSAKSPDDSSTEEKEKGEKQPLQEEDDLTVGKTFAHYYLLRTRLGAGNGGQVFEALDTRTGERVAIKEVKKRGFHPKQSKQQETRKRAVTAKEASPEGLERQDFLGRKGERALKEAKVMAGLTHKRVVKLKEVIEREDSYCLILSYCAGGDLFDYIVRETKKRRQEIAAYGKSAAGLPREDGGIGKEEAWRIFEQLVEVVAFVHSKGFIHRDIKPENVFLDANLNPVLGDWGFAARWSNHKKKTRSCGSLNFAPGEILGGRAYVGPEVDIFALGGVMYTMLTGCLPFGSKRTRDTLERIIRGEWKMHSSLTSLEVALFDRVFEPHPLGRATALDLLNFINKRKQSNIPWATWRRTPGSPGLREKESEQKIKKEGSA